MDAHSRSLTISSEFWLAGESWPAGWLELVLEFGLVLSLGGAADLVGTRTPPEEELRVFLSPFSERATRREDKSNPIGTLLVPTYGVKQVAAALLNAS